MFSPPVLSRCLLLATGVLTSTIIIGCIEDSQPRVQTATSSEKSVVTTDELLARSAMAHERLSTLRATGIFRDHRRGQRRVLPIRWELARPDRCRLQIDQDVAIVLKDQWWSYRPDVGRFRSHNLLTRTPIETAGSLLSDGVAFPLPSLFLRGVDALEKDRSGRLADWQLSGVGWLGSIPCYVFERSETASDPPTLMRLYLDQATLLLRGWSLEVSRDDGDRRLLIEVQYTELLPNVALRAGTFQIHPPEPLALPIEIDTASSP